MVNSETLASMELFQGLPADGLRAIAALCREETFPVKTVFFALDRPVSNVYLLLEGSVGLTIETVPTSPPLTVSILNSHGQIFGWSAIVGPSNYTATAQARTDVRAIALDGHAVMSYLEQHPDIGFVVLRRLAQLISMRMSELRRLLTETIRDYEHAPEAQHEN